MSCFTNLRSPPEASPSEVVCDITSWVCVNLIVSGVVVLRGLQMMIVLFVTGRHVHS